MINFDDFILHTKAGGQVIKKFKCTCDLCGKDRGYLPKSKASKHCLTCVRSSVEYRENLKQAIKRVRSSSESRNKTKQANDIRWQEIRAKKQEQKEWKKANPNWWKTQEWKQKISLKMCGKTSPNKGKKMTLQKRIESSCIRRNIDIKDFTTFSNNSPQSRIKRNISSRIYQILKKRNSKKSNAVLGSLNFSINELVAHLESKFHNHPISGEPMTWDNYGKYGWHIDHAVPDSWFNYSSEQDADFNKSWSLNNLKPMWAFENLKKNNKYVG